MAMYFMNGKTFLQYVKDKPSKALKSQYVLVSSTIRKSGKYEKQVINANNMLYPNQHLIMEYDDYKNNEQYHNEYIDQISEHDPFFATLIMYVIKEDTDIIFICGEKEKKYRYLKIIQKYLLERFRFYMYDYKNDNFKIPKGINVDDDSVVLSLCKKILKDAAKKQKKKMLESSSGREKLFKSMSKKELKKELKKRDLYIEGMSKSEMIDTLDTFM